MHISKSERCYDAQSLWYYFYIKANVLQDFHICINVPLKISIIKMLSRLVAHLRRFKDNCEWFLP